METPKRSTSNFQRPTFSAELDGEGRIVVAGGTRVSQTLW